MAAAAVSAAAQGFQPRAPLTPAETLLEPAILRAIDEAAPDGSPVSLIDGSDAAADEILLHCKAADPCVAAMAAARKLHSLVASGRLPQPTRAIRVASAPTRAVRVVLHLAKSDSRTMQVVRSPWSAADIADEVVEILSTQAPYGTVPGSANVRAFEDVGQPRWDAAGVPTPAIVAAGGADGDRQAAFVAAASSYFLATLPNAGAEALLSHLTVGAHARLAEDGRRAVALMGNQQRASGEVLILLAQAIEREQRRMRSFEPYMPAPVDPMLRSRLADMQKGITAVWTSLGITSSPFVPAAERIRGRGGEDRRVPTRVAGGAPPPDPAALSIAKVRDSAAVAYEILNFVDGTRSISDIRDAVSAEFGAVPLPAVVEYLEAAAKGRLVTIK